MRIEGICLFSDPLVDISRRDREQQLHAVIAAIEERVPAIGGKKTSVVGAELPPILHVPQSHVQDAMGHIDDLVAWMGKGIAALAGIEFNETGGEHFGGHGQAYPDRMHTTVQVPE